MNLGRLRNFFFVKKRYRLLINLKFDLQKKPETIYIYRLVFFKSLAQSSIYSVS